MPIRVTLLNTVTGATEETDLPDDEYVVLACRWSDAVEKIAAHLGAVNGIMRHWKAEELADQAVEALANSPLLMRRPVTHETEHELTYLIWSNEHGAWWRPGERGYTDRVQDAGRYPLDRAEAIVGHAGNHGPMGEPNEVRVLAPEHRWVGAGWQAGIADRRAVTEIGAADVTRAEAT